MMRDFRRGFTLIELLIVITVIAILAAIAVTNGHKHIMLAHEQAAIEEIRTLHKAEAQYYAQFTGYARSLAQLGPPESGSDGPGAANLIPRSLADGHASGYIFSLAGTTEGYAITALPETYKGTGSRAFYSDQSMTIHQNYSSEPATAASPELR
jgi:prepilin-type N-terminal cleavage/methylation domain-containing protein